MQHLIIGMGNLGRDLSMALKVKGEEVIECSLNDAYPNDCRSQKPAFVWCTAGAGSVGEAKKDFSPFLNLHVGLVNDLIKHFTVPVITFSSDYAPVGNSLYALSKSWMEDLVLHYRNSGRNVFAIRVCSLYGAHKPERTFPGKLLKNYPLPSHIKLPSNSITPTPTSWLGEVLSSKYYKFMNGDFKNSTILELAPAGVVSVLDWGKLILGPSYTYDDAEFYDFERPQISNIGNDFQIGHIVDWRELWELNRSFFQSHPPTL